MANGLNKDAKEKNGFQQARTFAIRATKAYVESILNQPDVLNNKEAVRLFTGGRGSSQ